MKMKVHLRWNTEDHICKWLPLVFKRGHLLRGRGLKEDSERPRLVLIVSRSELVFTSGEPYALL